MIRNEPLEFETPKNIFDNPFVIIQNKKKLYESKSIDQIIKSLCQYHIDINPKKVLEEYKKCFDFQKLLDHYHTLHHEALMQLETLGILLDGDCLVFLFDCLIKKNYDIYEVPDKYYIIQTLLTFKELKNKDKINTFINIKDHLLVIVQRERINVLSILFQDSHINIEKTLLNCMNDELLSYNMCFNDALEICYSIDSLINYCDLDYAYLFYAFTIQLLASYGYVHAVERFESGLNIYPTHQFLFFKNLFLGLYKNALDTQNTTDYDRIYKDAMKMHIYTKEDQQHHDFMKKFYNETYIGIK